jgi:hypothetical protein
MRLFPTTSSAARTSLAYITVGALLVIWMCVWGVYLLNNVPDREGLRYLCLGLLISGLALIVIGLATGRIGGAARNADVVQAVVAPPSTVDPDSQPLAAIAQPVPTDAVPPLAVNKRD